ncbi:Transcription initiation factor TFIID subunit [Lachnellula willkommii]|uniref:Transcription initiation factor TFIID subunit n=1 Tax=Lachnellula willkommii TaxID=215461 RepID=A0A559MN97_9HELO|nr:Transcription initiation factor TFIID subunit [Lachnellula willkommii]
MSGIKLKLNTGIPRDASLATPSATPGAGPASTPRSSTPGGPKLKLIAKSTPSTPAPTIEDVPKPKKTKAGRASKPSAKLLESKKRPPKDVDSESENEGSTIAVQPPAAKRVKISFGPKTPAIAQTPVHIKPKLKGKPPKHPPGDGYDSEASDRELDPTIEEEFVLRMFPGDDCEYLREAIVNKKIGLPLSQGGADVQMKFYEANGRRASVNIRSHLYAATLVDLPCIVEGMKSWDKRGWWKSADICQMLWVFAPIAREDEAKTIPLPNIIDPKTFQYPHGLTPPMHYARKRRFRKRISRTAIEAVEAEVERLMTEDKAAVSSKWEMFDVEEESRRESAFSPESSPDGYEDGQGQYSEDDDAEGEVDDTPGYFGQEHHVNGAVDEAMDAELEAELEAAMQAENLEAATPMSTNEGATLNGGTPGRVEEDSGDESVEDEDADDEDDSEGGIDEEARAKLAQIQGMREDIVDLEKQIENVQAQLAAQTNMLLKKRLEDNVRKLKAELQLKKSSIGEGDGDEDD